MQLSALDTHLVSRRNQIDVAGLDLHSVAGTVNRRRGLGRDQLGHQAVVIGIEVLDQHDDHIVGLGQPGQKRLKGLQSTC